MSRRVVVIGAGVGGLSAAIRLAHHGYKVTVVEARDSAGGLASGFERDGFRFDSGPYILLDRPGLEWAFQQLGIPPEQQSRLTRIKHVYEVDDGIGSPVSIFDSLDRTASGFEDQWQGAGELYRKFVEWTGRKHHRMQPLQWISRPGPFDLLRTGAWRDLPFVIRRLAPILKSTGLPNRITDTLSIWTQVAGQLADHAPSPLALVTSVIHRNGACYPDGGINSVPQTLFNTAVTTGVEFRFGTRVNRIISRDRNVTAVEVNGDVLPADFVMSNVGLTTYSQLLDEDGRSALGKRAQTYFNKLPLQSPGVCAYLAVKGKPRLPYLRFHIRNQTDGCRLLITPGVVDPSLEQAGWYPARLLAPMSHTRAQTGGESGQREFLDQVLHQEDWWRQHFEDVRVLETRIPNEWGTQFHLHRNSMNPVMTARFMLTGRVAHRSPWIKGLYLTGSATHPGQWVSFCTVSGILAADRLLSDDGGS